MLGGGVLFGQKPVPRGQLICELLAVQTQSTQGNVSIWKGEIWVHTGASTTLAEVDMPPWCGGTSENDHEAQLSQPWSTYSQLVQYMRGLLGSTSGKESACNARDVRDVSSVSG